MFSIKKMVRKYNLLCSCFSKYKKQNCTIIIDKNNKIRKIIHNRKHVCYFNNPIYLDLKNPYISNL
jgi:hypothetical protein